MKAVLPLVRMTVGFLLGAFALLIPFVLLITFAVLRANVSHGAPNRDDYRFAAIAIGLLTAAFAAGVALLGRGKQPGVPLRAAMIAGAGAVSLLLITMMVVGEPLGLRGTWAVAGAVGGLASWATFRWWPAPARLSAAPD